VIADLFLGDIRTASKRTARRLQQLLQEREEQLREGERRQQRQRLDLQQQVSLALNQQDRELALLVAISQELSRRTQQLDEDEDEELPIVWRPPPGLRPPRQRPMLLQQHLDQLPLVPANPSNLRMRQRVQEQLVEYGSRSQMQTQLQNHSRWQQAEALQLQQFMLAEARRAMEWQDLLREALRLRREQQRHEGHAVAGASSRLLPRGLHDAAHWGRPIVATCRMGLLVRWAVLLASVRALCPRQCIVQVRCTVQLPPRGPLHIAPT
jgi:hypothetical protein